MWKRLTGKYRYPYGETEIWYRNLREVTWEREQRGRVQWPHTADYKCRKGIKCLLKHSWKTSDCHEWKQYPYSGTRKIPESTGCYFHDRVLLRKKGNKW